MILMGATDFEFYMQDVYTLVVGVDCDGEHPVPPPFLGVVNGGYMGISMIIMMMMTDESEREILGNRPIRLRRFRMCRHRCCHNGRMLT